jgi:hypothetical protein
MSTYNPKTKHLLNSITSIIHLYVPPKFCVPIITDGLLSQIHCWPISQIWKRPPLSFDSKVLSLKSNLYPLVHTCSLHVFRPLSKTSIVVLPHPIYNSVACHGQLLDLNSIVRPINVATLALGSRPRQRGCKGAGQEKARESHHILLECRKMWGSEPSHSQFNFHFGRWSLGGLPKLQRAISRVKTQWLVAFFISLESS